DVARDVDLPGAGAGIPAARKANARADNVRRTLRVVDRRGQTDLSGAERGSQAAAAGASSALLQPHGLDHEPGADPPRAHLAGASVGSYRRSDLYAGGSVATGNLCQ